MARYRAAFNPTDRPVVVDDEGRTLAGRAWGPVVEAAPEVRAARERGELTFVDRPKGDDDLDPAAAAVFDAVDELNAAPDAEAIAEAADEHGAPPTKAARKAAATTEEAKAR